MIFQARKVLLKNIFLKKPILISPKIIIKIPEIFIIISLFILRNKPIVVEVKANNKKINVKDNIKINVDKIMLLLVLELIFPSRPKVVR